MLYAAPVWYPNTSPSRLQKLQSIQNSALRISSGSLRMSSVSHLHRECSMLPVKESLELLSNQYLTGALRSEHPVYSLMIADPGPRRIRDTLRSKVGTNVEHLLVDGIMTQDLYSASIRSLHTEAVSRAIAEAGPNRVLGTPPPLIDPSEIYLPRPCRTTLAQLRSGFCSALLSYKHRIGIVADPLCPECSSEEHSVTHIFSCPSFPTPLHTLSLWESPSEVINFLSSVPSFNYLPPLPRPPPEPPPVVAVVLDG